MKIYIITQHESDDYCGIGGTWFDTEAYSSKEKAEARLAYLKKEHSSHGAFYYILDVAILDVEAEV